MQPVSDHSSCCYPKNISPLTPPMQCSNQPCPCLGNASIENDCTAAKGRSLLKPVCQSGNKQGNQSEKNKEYQDHKERFLGFALLLHITCNIQQTVQTTFHLGHLCCTYRRYCSSASPPKLMPVVRSPRLWLGWGGWQPCWASPPWQRPAPHGLLDHRTWVHAHGLT